MAGGPVGCSIPWSFGFSARILCEKLIGCAVFRPSVYDGETSKKTTTMNQNFLCPITQSVMTDPVIGSDGITYERAAIEAWFAAGHATSPLTRAPMTSQSLVPNYALKALIEEVTASGTTLSAGPAVTPTTLLERVPPPPITIRSV